MTQDREYTLWVDADSCPKKLRSIILRAAIRCKVRCVYVADRPLPDISNRGVVSQVCVEGGEDAADSYIVEHIIEGDTLITKDVPCADRAVAAGAVVVDHMGRRYTQENIKERLSWRNALTQLRDEGVFVKTQQQLGQKELREFSAALEQELRRMLALPAPAAQLAQAEVAPVEDIALTTHNASAPVHSAQPRHPAPTAQTGEGEETAYKSFVRKIGGTMSEEEREYLKKKQDDVLTPLITKHIANLICKGNPAIRAQFVPTGAELCSTEGELKDPLGGENYMHVDRLIHQYEDRALFLSTMECPVHCRYCFRKSMTSDFGAASQAELDEVAAYLKEHRELKEVLISGGDSLGLSTLRIAQIVDSFRAARPDIAFRWCTRVPIVDPTRVDDKLWALLERSRPASMALHLNHASEFSPESDALIARLKELFPIKTQTVLLKGVNDKLEDLVELYAAIYERGITPYYLFQGDLAKGTSHFRVSPLRGRQLMLLLARRMKELHPDFVMPRYALDVPGGGGKFSLMHARLIPVAGGWKIKPQNKPEFFYPEP